MRRPGPRNTLRPTRSPAPFCHPVTLRYTLQGDATLTCDAGKSRNGCRISGKACGSLAKLVPGLILAKGVAYMRTVLLKAAPSAVLHRERL
jgi:hypothetical protein